MFLKKMRSSRRAIKRFIWKAYIRWMMMAHAKYSMLAFENASEAFMVETFFAHRSFELSEGDISRRIVCVPPGPLPSHCWITPMRVPRSMIRRNIYSIDIFLDHAIPKWDLKPLPYPRGTGTYINTRSPQPLHLIHISILVLLNSISQGALLRMGQSVLSISVGTLENRVALSRIFHRSFVNRLFSL